MKTAFIATQRLDNKIFKKKIGNIADYFQKCFYFKRKVYHA